MVSQNKFKNQNKDRIIDGKRQHLHIIGICGVATSALAIAFHDKGWKVTGSDKGFFPPVSTELEKHGIDFYAGWHTEKIGSPDIVVIGTASGSQNPETTYVKEKNIPIYSFAEAIGKFFVKEHSIVVVGTWGKTSSSALLSFILEKSGFDPSYMFGGISLSHSASAKLTNSKWCILEGDEYKSSPIDNTPKFTYYKPTHLFLTAVSWDHADLYPTEESYFETFKKLVSSIPKKGLILANKDDKGVDKILEKINRKVIYYGKEKVDRIQKISRNGEIGKDKTDYTYRDVRQTKDGLDFTISHKEKNYKIHSPMIGEFQAENIAGCFAMAHQIGITPEKIVKAIEEFKGLKRRLEKRFEGDMTVFDDIAHSPEKAASVLENIHSIYRSKYHTTNQDKNGKQVKILAIFEPTIRRRQRESSYKYDNAFKNADTVVIPRLTKLKVSKEKPMEGDELAEVIKKTQPNVIYIEDDKELVKYIVKKAHKDDVIVFLGSHGFRGMIEETITSLRQ